MFCSEDCSIFCYLEKEGRLQCLVDAITYIHLSDDDMDMDVIG